MTKKERLRRARRIRQELGLFVSYQTAYMEKLLREKNVNPGYAAMNRLLMARHELSTLITDLYAEGYGKMPSP